MYTPRMQSGLGAASALVAVGVLAGCNLTDSVRTTPGDPGEQTFRPPPPPTSLDGGGGADGGGGGGAGGVSIVPMAICGDGELQAGEDCDRTEFSKATCADYGFESGTLACTHQCTVDTSGCVGKEICNDGVDNDGDGLIDCDDPDCTASCLDSCSAPTAITLPMDVTGDTRGLSELGTPSCTPDGAGPGQAYQITAPSDGTLQVNIEQGDFIGISVRKACGDATTELACNLDTVSVPVKSGDVLYVVFQGFESGISGSFEALLVMLEGA